MEAFDLTFVLGALPKQLVAEARGDRRIFRMAAIAAIMEAQSYTQGVLWAHTPRGTGLASGLMAFDPPAAYEAEPMGYIGWQSPAGRYLRFVEMGTQPFKPPLGPLMYWAGRKFGNPAIAYRAFGAIKAKGIRKQEFVKAAAAEAQPIASQIMSNRIVQYISDWGK